MWREKAIITRLNMLRCKHNQVSKRTVFFPTHLFSRHHTPLTWYLLNLPYCITATDTVPIWYMFQVHCGRSMSCQLCRKWGDLCTTVYTHENTEIFIGRSVIQVSCPPGIPRSSIAAVLLPYTIFRGGSLSRKSTERRWDSAYIAIYTK